MDDPTKFANVTQFHIAYYAIAILCVSELAVWLFTSFGNRGKKRSSDSGTIWLVIVGWCFGILAGAYFRSRSVSSVVRSMVLPNLFYYIGIVLILSGILLRCTAVLTLKKAFTLTVQTASDQHLITTGLYRIVRNPAYTGSILSLLGVSLAYRSFPGAIAVILVCLLCYGIRIHVEEKALKAQFHQEFEQYCSRTKYRLFPKIY